MVIKTIKSKKYKDKEVKLVYNTSRYDEWCVYAVSSTTGKKYPITYEQCFGRLLALKNCYNINVFNDFINIYDKTKNRIDTDVLDYINNISEKYKGEIHNKRYNKTYDASDIANFTYTSLYTMMVSEENKKNTILGKIVTFVCVYALLKLNEPVDSAVNCVNNLDASFIRLLYKYYN